MKEKNRQYFFFYRTESDMKGKNISYMNIYTVKNL